MKNMTTTQIQFIKDFAPQMIVENDFAGDDNDFSCIVSDFARKLARQGLAEAAVEITFNLQPEGFINGTRAQFLKHFESAA